MSVSGDGPLLASDLPPELQAGFAQAEAAQAE
jgi:hypothetical protein